MLFRLTPARIALLLLLFAGCATTPRTINAPRQENADGRLAAIHQIANRLPDREYRIGPGYVLEISVHGVEELAATVRVPKSGTFDFPLVGNVRATGRTAPEVQQAIASVLRQRYVNDPHVNVFIDEFNSYRISVVGAVNEPGTVVMQTGGCTVVDALAEAAGLSKTAGNQLYVTTCDDSGKSSVTHVDLDNLLVKGDLSENQALQPGDSIFVPEGGYVFVTGHVNDPGAYELRKGMTALQAISTAGDFLDTASHEVQLVRKVSSTQVRVKHIDLAAVSRGKQQDISLRRSDVLKAKGSMWKVPVYGTFDFFKSVLGIGTSIR